MDDALITAMVERLRLTDPWRNWKGNASFEAQCREVLPVVREAVEREIAGWLRDQWHGRLQSAVYLADAIEASEYRKDDTR